MAFSYNLKHEDPAIVLISKVRLEIGDTVEATDTEGGVTPDGANFSDDELQVWLGEEENNTLKAAARACEALAIRWADAGEVVQLKGYQISSVSKSLNYQRTAERLWKRAQAKRPVMLKAY